MTPPESTPELAFVLAEGQNLFFNDLVGGLRFELDRAGIESALHVGAFPEPRRGLVTILVPPHEYVALSGFELPPGILRRTIMLSAEQPASGFFSTNVRLGQRAGAVFDINKRAVHAYRVAGVDATHLQLGHSDAWDRHDQADDRRDIDVLFLGRHTDRRARYLARAASLLEHRSCHLVLTDNSRPSAEATGGFLADQEKLTLLSRAKVLLNIHAEDEPYFEWLRVIEAVCCGCVVVSEHSTDIAPLMWGEHLLTGDADSLALLAAIALDGHPLRHKLARQAYELLKYAHPLSAAASLLAEAAADIDRAPVDPFERTLVLAHGARLRMERAQAPSAELLQPPEDPAISIGERRLLRAVKAQQGALLGLRPAPTTIVVQPAVASHHGDVPIVSVIVPLYNYAQEVVDTLESVRGSTFRDLEIVVVDDASTDGSRDAVLRWVADHPDVSVHLVAHEVNRGLSAARNTGATHARADLLLMLDADNEIRRRGIERLVDALRGDPSAAFAYGILERFSEDEGASGLLSWHAWQAERFRVGNYIDALALIRRAVLRDAGGYSLDSRLALGWEDYDLWVRLAEGGDHGVFVPQIVGRYRAGRSSMLSVTNLSGSDAYAAIADHAPNLMRGVEIPGVGSLA
jgi:hypothetical protein